MEPKDNELSQESYLLNKIQIEEVIDEEFEDDEWDKCEDIDDEDAWLWDNVPEGLWSEDPDEVWCIIESKENDSSQLLKKLLEEGIDEDWDECEGLSDEDDWL